MTKIAEQQNMPESIRLLVAQARLYTEAKRIRLLRLFVSAALAAAAPIITLFVPHSDVWLAGAGFVWMLTTYFPFRGRQLEKTKQAATIQEQLDTTLFTLPWNEVLVGSHVKPEIIYQAERTSKENSERFRNWYSDPGDLPYSLAVLLCQRANTVWDWRLRRHYAAGAAWLVAIVLLIDFLIGLLMRQSLSAFLFGLLIPTLPALQQGVETVLSHRESAAEKEELAQRIEALWEIGVRDPDVVRQDQLRQIQDRIYVLRKDGPLVPDRWYKWLQKNYQADMDKTVQELKAQAEEAIKKK
ncbi:MAG: S-4TM family putative pore-forming effector [Ktedonobacteraceae bacterium]